MNMRENTGGKRDGGGKGKAYTHTSRKKEEEKGKWVEENRENE